MKYAFVPLKPGQDPPSVGDQIDAAIPQRGTLEECLRGMVEPGGSVVRIEGECTIARVEQTLVAGVSPVGGCTLMDVCGPRPGTAHRGGDAVLPYVHAGGAVPARGGLVAGEDPGPLFCGEARAGGGGGHQHGTRDCRPRWGGARGLCCNEGE